MFIWHDLFIAGNILSKKDDVIGDTHNEEFLEIHKSPEVFSVFHITMLSDAQNNKAE